jgi:hypothetical protein
MPSLQLILKTPEENAPTSGTIIVERDTDSRTTVGNHRDKSKNVYGASKDPFDVTAEFGVGSTKKRKGSVLEQLNYDADDDSKKVSKKKKTILDFYSSLSPKQDTGAQSDDESIAKVVEKKTPSKAAKFVALNEDAKPIHVHISFAGQEKNSAVTIETHCVESKYDFCGKPLLLNGEYPRGSKTSIARFMSGFGRYCL